MSLVKINSFKKRGGQFKKMKTISVPFQVIRSELKENKLLSKNKVTASDLELLIKFDIGLSNYLFDRYKNDY